MRSRLRFADRFLRRASACGLVFLGAGLAAAAAQQEPPHSAALDRMIVEQAKRNGVPEKLVRRIVMRESKYDASARNHKYWGLMQISFPTAKSMGFKGTPEQLLNPLVNLTYAVPYLANAFIIAGKREDEAVRLYAAGYYYTARQRGLLGMLRTADSDPAHGYVDSPEPFATAEAQPQSAPVGVYGSLPQRAPGADAPPSAMDKAAAATVVSLVADRSGELHPPKKWARDGGVTQVPRGEQSLESVVAYAGPKEDKPSRRASHTTRKSTEFASIDVPSSAQAYATAGGGDPRFAQAPSQAAIAQATEPSAFGAQPQPQDAAVAPPQPGQPEAGAPVATAEQAPAAQDEAPTKRSRHSARRSRRHGNDDGETQVAKSDQTPAADDAGDKKVSHKRIARHAKPKAEDETAVAAAQHPDNGADLRN